jgi:hypothetical protein
VKLLDFGSSSENFLYIIDPANPELGIVTDRFAADFGTKYSVIPISASVFFYDPGISWSPVIGGLPRLHLEVSNGKGRWFTISKGVGIPDGGDPWRVTYFEPPSKFFENVPLVDFCGLRISAPDGSGGYNRIDAYSQAQDAYVTIDALIFPRRSFITGFSG